MSEIKITRIEPLEIPADIVGRISAKQHIALKDFYFMCRKKIKCMSINPFQKRILRK